MSFVLLSRKFARFVLGHPVPIAFRSWIKDTLNPDESYFNTLARITHLKRVQGLNDFKVNTSNTLDTHEILVKVKLLWVFSKFLNILQVENNQK